MSDEFLSITQVAEATGLRSSALRYYEKAGLITPAGRRGGRRLYSAVVLDRLAAIALLQEVGFTIGEIAELLDREVAWRSLAERKLQEIDEHLERVAEARELLTSALSCGCSTLERCDLVANRRGRHRRVTQTLTLRVGPPGS